MFAYLINCIHCGLTADAIRKNRGVAVECPGCKSGVMTGRNLFQVRESWFDRDVRNLKGVTNGR